MRPGYLVGEARATSGHAPAFQSALPPTVLLPESFRGGCSFGAGRNPGLSHRGASGAATLAPCRGDSQRRLRLRLPIFFPARPDHEHEAAGFAARILV